MSSIEEYYKSGGLSGYIQREISDALTNSSNPYHSSMMLLMNGDDAAKIKELESTLTDGNHPLHIIMLRELYVYKSSKITKTFQKLIEEMGEKFVIGEMERIISPIIGKCSAAIRHEKNNLKREKIQQIWASGKYSSRDICAEQECAALNMSFSTARKALRNTPDPT